MAGTTNMGASTRQPTGFAQPTGAGTSQPMGVARMMDVEHNKPMGNGGGPEPHQGGNPGAQSDPGSKEIGFYDRAQGHMGGDDGVQNTAERPSPMRMGGVDGSQPNAGQRGGQNTGTSGSQTTSNAGQSGSVGDRGASQSNGATMMTGSTADMAAGGGPHDGYYSRAASQLTGNENPADMPSGRMGDSVQDFDSTPAASSGAAPTFMDKARDFADRTKNRAETMLNVDFDNDGVVGTQAHPQEGNNTYGGNADTNPMPDWQSGRQQTDAPGTAGATGMKTAPAAQPQSAQQPQATQQTQATQQPQGAMQPQSAMQPESAQQPQASKEPGMPNQAQEPMKKEAKPTGNETGVGEKQRPASLDYTSKERSVMRTDGVSRTDAQQREKEQAVA